MGSPEDYNTGIAPKWAISYRAETEKDFVELWFSKPLTEMKGDDAFICLTVCFPLIESIIRYEQGIADNQDVVFSDGSPALQWFAKFMQIPEAISRPVWDGLRNGLLHRAMVKIEFDYELTGKRKGRPAEYDGSRVIIYVWDLRDAVVSLVRKYNKKLWKGTGSPLPRVYLTP
jgi:hypothetical protein